MSNLGQAKQSAQTNNHAAGKAAKIEIRRRVLAHIEPPAHVCDLFAGAGEMFKAVWYQAASYLGCDRVWYRDDDRLMFCCDNRRVMRSIDLAAFNVFDLDAFGSPWEQALILAARRPMAPGERIGIAMTEGSGLKLKTGELPHALARLCSLSPRLAGVFRWHGDITDRAIAGMATIMGARVAKRFEAHRPAGSAVRYIGLVLEAV